MPSADDVEVQDNARELDMLGKFGLLKPADEGRSGIDAVLRFNGRLIPFELKSTTNGSVTTVRDFGPEHIQKWKGKHWLIGHYNRRQILQYTIYVSPEEMEPWILEKEEYIRSDFELADHVPLLVGSEILTAIAGNKAVFSLKDARKLQKRQYSIQQYKDLMDIDDGYSRERMLKILQDRCGYLIRRGSTLNNPHIPASYFVGKGVRIDQDHARSLLSALGRKTTPKST